MILVIEDALSEILVSGFKDLQANPSQVTDVLSMDANKLQSLQTVLSTTPVKIIRGYPRVPTVLPCIAIMLSGDEETEIGLGDVSDDEDITVNSATDILTEVHKDTNGQYLQLTNRPVAEVTSYLDSQGLPIEYSYTNFQLGKIYVSNIPSFPVTVIYDYNSLCTENIEALFDSNYRLEVWTMNGDLTVQLYHLLRYIMLKNRPQFLSLGLMIQRMGGSDFKPVTSFFPDFVYTRVLTFSTKLTVSVPLLNAPYVQSIVGNEILI